MRESRVEVLRSSESRPRPCDEIEHGATTKHTRGRLVRNVSYERGLSATDSRLRSTRQGGNGQRAVHPGTSTIPTIEPLIDPTGDNTSTSSDRRPTARTHRSSATIDTMSTSAQLVSHQTGAFVRTASENGSVSTRSPIAAASDREYLRIKVRVASSKTAGINVYP